MARQGESGGWTATQSFITPRGSLDDLTFQNDFRKNRPITELDPNRESRWGFLELHNVTEVADQRGGLTRLRVFFGGYGAPVEGGTTTTEPVYELRGTVEERSILEHPDVKLAADADQVVLHNLIHGQRQYTWNTTSGKLEVYVYNDEPDVTSEWDVQPSASVPTGANMSPQTIAKKILIDGVRTYRHPRFVWSKRWQDNTAFTGAEVNNLGRIDAPDGDPPEPANDRDWLLENAFQEQVGNLYYKSKDWLLSEREGWDADIYKA